MDVSLVNRVIADANPVPYDHGNLNELICIFRLNIPDETTYEEKRRCCFKATVKACQNSELYAIEKARDFLPGLQDSAGRNILFFLIEHKEKGSVECIKQILENKFHGFLCSKYFHESLHVAVKYRRIDLLSLLLLYVGMDQLDSEGRTPLYVAIEMGHEEMVEALVKCGVSQVILYRHKESGFEFSPIAWAVAQGQIECFDKLASEANPLWFSKSCNLLHVAIQFGQMAMLRHLMTQYSEKTKNLIDKPDNQGRTPLFLAVYLGDYESILLLHEKKASLSIQDECQYTPLHIAAMQGHRHIIGLLAYLGADLKAGDIHGNPPSHVAKEESIKECIVNLIKQAGKNALTPPDFCYRPPQNLVFKGGGPRGIAYIGAIKELEKKGALREVVRVAGTSAGAITALLLSIGCTGDEILDLLKATPLESLLDHPLTKENLKESAKKNLTISNLLNIKEIIKKITNPKPLKILQMLWKVTGLCEGKKAIKWLEGVIEKKTGKKHCTFGELRTLIEKKGPTFKHLHVFATKLGKEPEIFHFSSEDEQWEDLIISDAIRASMSIPAVFKPHFLYFKDNRERRHAKEHWGSFVDGGLIYNFPIKTFDYKGYIENGLSPQEGAYPLFNRRTLGFNLYSSTETSKIIEERPIDSVGDLIMGLYRVFTNAEALISQQDPSNESRTIQIDTKEIGLLDFKLTDKQQQMLINSGSFSAQNKFNNNINPFGTFFILPSSSNKAKSVNLKIPLKKFVNRDEVLYKIKTALIHENTSETKNRISCFTIYGAKGVGKTEFACTFANKQMKEFSLIHWIDCENELIEKQGYRSLAKLLDIFVDTEASLQEIKDSVFDSLENYTSVEPWLLIFDHAYENMPLPKRGGSILCISDQEKVTASVAQSLKILPFNDKEAIKLFKDFSGQGDKKHMGYLASSLNYLPLGLSVAAAYLTKAQISVSDYLDILSPQQNDPSQKEGLLNSLEKSITVTLEQIKKEFSNAYDWINICVYFTSKDIPIQWIEKWLHVEKNLSGSELRQTKEKVLKILQELEIVRCDEKTATFFIHPLCQGSIQSVQTDSNDYKKAFAWLQKEGRSFEKWDESKTVEAECWLIHIKSVLTNPFSLKLDRENFGIALKMVAKLEMNLSSFAESYESCTKSFDVFQEVHGAIDHPSLAECLHIKGVSSQYLGKYEEALECHSQSLKMRKKIYNPFEPHLEIAESLYHQGISLHTLGKHEEALKNYQESLKIQKKLLGPENANVAVCLMAMGAVNQKVGKHLDALQSFEKSLNIREKIYKNSQKITDNVLFADSLSSVGIAQCSLGNHDQSLKAHEKSHSILKEIYESRACVRIANSLHNQGVTLLALNNIEKGPSLLRQAYDMRKKIYGKLLHTDIACSLSSLGDASKARKEFENAKQHYLDALKVYQEVNPKSDVTDPFIQHINASIYNMTPYPCSLQ